MNYEDMTIKLIKNRFESAKKEVDELLSYFKGLSNSQHKSICLFGTGELGNKIYSYLQEKQIKVDFFCDNNKEKWGNVIKDNIECISLDELEKRKDDVTVIICVGNDNNIFEQLCNMGINNVYIRPQEIFNIDSNNIFMFSENEIIDNIKTLLGILEDEYSKKIVYYKMFAMLSTMDELKDFTYKNIATFPQYFPDDIVKLIENEVFVDCGSYIGDTLSSFIQQDSLGNLKEYICYELDINNFNLLKAYVDKLENKIKSKISIYNLGISDKNEQIKYSFNGGATSALGLGNIYGEVISIDEHIGCKGITFLKMDIEGSESFALIGAKNSIKRNKPKCGISIYHKASDLWEIPIHLKQLVPEYRIYLRHHSLTYCDTVCYAIL